MQLLVRAFTALLIFIFVSSNISAQIAHLTPKLVSPKSIDKDYYPLDINTKMIYESTFGETTCITRKDGDNYQQEFTSDGFEMFQNGTLLRQSDKKMVDYFIDYFRGKQNLYIPPLGRQIDISKK